jgi:hypothetical protein
MERRYRGHTSVRLRAGPDVPVSAMPPSALPPIGVALGDGPVSILAAGHTLWLRTGRTKGDHETGWPSATLRRSMGLPPAVRTRQDPAESAVAETLGRR